MLKFNLAQLLAARNMSISALSSKTGISRKTYSQLANNESKGIQLNTLEAIIRELDCKVEDVITTGQDEAMVMFRLSDHTANQGITISCLTLANADSDNETMFNALLNVTATATPNGNVLSYIYPITKIVDDIKFPDEHDKIIAIVANAGKDAVQALSASIMALALTQTNIEPAKKGTCTVVWSHDGEAPVNVSTISNKTVTADQVTAKPVLVDGLNISNAK